VTSMEVNPGLIALLTIVANGAVTWGVVQTHLAWLRKDVDRANERLDNLEQTLYTNGARK
jgi:hypothetical protein